MIWKILEIEKTKNEDMIKAAYREKLRYVNPEDDEEGFKELRRAYEEAMEYAALPEEIETEETEVPQGKMTEVDKWLERVDRVYQDVALRRQESSWKTLLNDPVCDDLDTEIEASEKLLVYFMSHNFLPQSIWIMIDNRFHYRENYTQLLEHFPENYLEYVKWQIENQDFFDYSLFEGKLDDRADEYMNLLYQLKSCIEQPDLETCAGIIKELKRFDISHPFALVEEAEYDLKKAKEENGLEYNKEALSIMEEMDFEFSDNDYVERVYADALVANDMHNKALEIYDTLIEKDPDNLNASIGKANCIYRMGNLEEAKELVEDVLEEQVQNTKCLALLDEINETLVKQYSESLEQELDKDVCYKLGWCYYQQKKFEEGIQLMDSLEESEEYDYVNLRCRLYLANENYESAYPLAKKWLALIEEAVDDGSKEAQRKKNRYSLAMFSLGICAVEIDFKDAATKEDKEKAFQLGTKYLNQAISNEQNLLVRLSYKEQLARFCLEAKKYEDCIKICTEIIEEDRGFFPAYVHRQKANFELKYAKEVIDDYFACKELYPAYVNPYLLAAEVFYAFDQFEDMESVIADAKEEGLESDTLQLDEIRILHYKEFSEENTKKALEMMEKLRESVYGKKTVSEALENTEPDQITDIEDFADLEREYAILYWDLDDISMTLRIVNSYLEEHPDNCSMLMLKADVLSREKNFEEALDIYKKLVALNRNNSYYRIRLGGGYERAKKYDDAIATYKQVLKEEENNEQAIRRLMYIYSFLSNRERDLEKVKIGIEYATRFIALNESAEGYVERGNLLIDLYELESAVADCKKAISLDSDAFYAYNNLGCALLKLRRLDEAIEPLEKVIEMRPDYEALPYINLAECFTIQKRYEEAIALYEKVMEIWPNRVGFMEEVANLYAKMGNYEKAVALFERIPEAFLELDGGKRTDNNFINNSLEACCDIIKLCSESGNYKLGNQYVKKAMKLLSKYKGNRYPAKIDNIIEYYRDQGDYKSAKQFGDKLFRIGKKRGYTNEKLILFAYVTVLFELGEREQAKKYVKRYFEQLFESEGPEEELFADKRYVPMHAYNFAIMNICRGDTERACEYLARIPDCKLCVMCISCDCFEYYFGMGLIAELNKRLQEAKCFYEKAIEIKGKYPSAENHLKKVNEQLKSM
ncbi:MAG: tetratricopeptide repeat protein [Lachnospiraceae bacterium]